MDLNLVGTITLLSTEQDLFTTSVQEFLVDPNALGYLIQYLETRAAGQLVKFWLDVESFRSEEELH